MPEVRAGVTEVEREVFSIVRRERRARDVGDWDVVRSLYWPDSVVRVTWFEGTAEEFIEVSSGSQQAGRAGGIHVINPAWSEVQGDRALVESQGQILIRPRLDGVECDAVNWCRFFSRLERRQGEWRLRSFDSIYGKDRVDPVLPGITVTFDAEELAAGRPSYKFLTYLNRRSGREVPQDLPGDDRPDLVAAFYADARAWLLDGDDAIQDRWRSTQRSS